MCVEIDFPARDAWPDEFLTILGREALGRCVEELHQLHPHLEIGAAVTARRDADAHVVVELAAYEALRHLEQPPDDDTLQHHTVVATEPARQHPRASRVDAQRQELAPDLRMRPALTLGLAVPLRLGTGG